MRAQWVQTVSTGRAGCRQGAQDEQGADSEHRPSRVKPHDLSLCFSVEQQLPHSAFFGFACHSRLVHCVLLGNSHVSKLLDLICLELTDPQSLSPPNHQHPVLPLFNVRFCCPDCALIGLSPLSEFSLQLPSFSIANLMR